MKPAPRWPTLVGASMLGLLAVVMVVAPAWATPSRTAVSPVIAGAPASGGPASGVPASGVTAPGVTSGPSGAALLSQSPFVAGGQSFHLQLAVSAPSPSTQIEVVIHSRLTTRTDFETALKGKLRSSADSFGPKAVSSLPGDPGGGVDFDIPVDSASGTGFTTTENGSGVYPVQVVLFDSSGNQTGTPLTTFLVYVSPGSGFPPLDVALTVPVHQPPSVARSGQTTHLPAVQSTALATLVATLSAHASIPLTLAATPQTLDALAAGSGTDRATLMSLASLAGGVDEVAGSAYADASLPSLVAAGMGREVAKQIATGTATLQAALHHGPAPGVWTVDGPVDQATLDSLTAAGVSQLIVPSSDLSALPAADNQTTLAAPTELATSHGNRLEVLNIDQGLADHFTNGGDQVLAANQLLAELAMVQLETPGESRGVAVVPPAGWQSDLTFLNIVLNGLSANPLLAPVTTASLLASVKVLGPSSDPLVRSLTAARPSAAALPASGAVREARAAVDAVGSIFPGDTARVASLDRLVLTSEADGLSAGQRKLVTDTVSASLTQLRHDISLPGASSITLTARTGDLPITVVSNGATGAQVELRLSSEKLGFQPFTPPRSRPCTTSVSGVEVCQLTLTAEATTLKVPVVARASGVFTLDVALSSPDGAIPLSDSRDTVRSTAFSGVGVILIVVAALALGFWWVRNIRHGRRARDLVPADVDEDVLADAVASDVAPPLIAPSLTAPPELSAAATEPGPHDGGLPAPSPRLQGGPASDGPPAGRDEVLAWMDEDPVIAEFFSSPAPVYPPPTRGSRP